MKLFTFLFILTIFSAKAERFVVVPYEVKANQSFDEILKIFTIDGSTFDKKSPSVMSTKNNNKHITSWLKLPEGEVLTLHLSSSVVDKNKVDLYEKKYKNTLLYWPSYFRKDSEFTGYYMNSRGNFSQTTSSRGDAKIKQDSPLTLGITSVKRLESTPDLRLITEFYLSQMEGSTNKRNVGKVKIPNEFGLSLYAEEKIDGPYHIFGGLDLERFTTIDIPRVYEELDNTLAESKILFATAGLTREFQLFHRNILTRVSYSKSIRNFKKGLTELKNTKALGGSIVQGYLRSDITQDWFIHAKIKKYSLSGASEGVSIMRTSIGFGYRFE